MHLNRQLLISLYIVATAAILLAVAASVPLYRLVDMPAGRLYAGTQFYSDDFNAYIQTIKQGIDNRWTVVDKFTSEPHSGSLFRIFYLVLGRIFGPGVVMVQNIYRTVSGLYFPIPPAAIVYHLGRLITGGFALFALWLLIKEFSFFTLPGQNALTAVIAWTLILFADILPRNPLAIFSSPVDWSVLQPLFREPEASLRFAFQPHFSFGIMSLCFLFAIFFRSLKSNRINKAHLLTVFVISFACSFIEPVSVLMVLTTLGVYTGVVALTHISLGKFPRIKIPFVFCLTLTLTLTLSTIYFYSLRSSLPWSVNSVFEQNQDFTFNFTELPGIFGYPLIFALLGLFALFRQKSAIRKNSHQILIIFSWVISFLILFYIAAPIILINRLRIFRQPTYIPVFLLSAYGLGWIYQKLSGVNKKLALTLTLTLTLFAILPSVPAFIASMHYQYLEFADHSSLAYPLLYQVRAFDWLDRHTPKNTVVAALYEAGSIIPSYSGNFTFTGNITETINYNRKAAALTDFFSGKLSSETALDFLHLNNINYVYWGHQERIGPDLTKLDYLHSVYSDPQINIFQVIK